MKPELTTSEALVLAGRNGSFNIGPAPGIKDLWVKLMEDYGRIEGQIGFRTFGVCHNLKGNPVSGGTMDYMAAVQVMNAGEVPGYLHTLIIPKRKVAIFRHEGKLRDLSKTWFSIFESWLPEAKLAVAEGPQFEVFSEDFDDDAGTGGIEIHIPVK